MPSAAASSPEATVARSAERSPTEHLEHLARSAQDALDAEAILIGARLSRGSELTPVSLGLRPELGREILAGLEPLVADREPVTVPELDDDPRTAGVVDWQAAGLGSLILAPLSWEGRELGAIVAFDPDRHEKSGAVERLLAAANQVALSVAYARLRKRDTLLSGEMDGQLGLDEIVLAATSVEELGVRLTERICLLGARTGGIMVLDEERGTLRLLPGGFGGGADETASYQVPIESPVSNSARVFCSGEPYVANGAEGDPGIMQDYVNLFHVKRLLSVPLTLGEKRLGVLHLANKPSPFSPTDVHRAQAIAPRFAVAVELGMTMLSLRRHQRATDILVDLAMGIASGRDHFEMIRVSFERVGDVVGTDLVALVSRDGEPMVWRRGKPAPELESALFEEALDRQSVERGLGEPRGAGDPGKATLFVPVRLAGKRIATIAVLRRRAEPFTSTERAVVVRLANLAAMGWATENYQRQRAEVAMLRERQRIADDLHDTVAQIMYAAQLDLDAVLERHPAQDSAKTRMVHARSLLIRGDAEVRNVIHQLSRPIRGDLPQRLSLLVESLEEEFSVGIRLEIPPPVGEACKSLRRSVVDALVKTAQEAIVNSAKHAGPCSIGVRLGISRRGRLVLSVVDDGVGGNGARNGYGLTSIRRTLRACGGLLQVSNPASGGTRVLASVAL